MNIELIVVGGFCFDKANFHSVGITDKDHEFKIALNLHGKFSNEKSTTVVTSEQRLGESNAYMNTIRQVQLSSEDPIETIRWYSSILKQLGATRATIDEQEALIHKEMTLWVPLDENTPPAGAKPEETKNEDSLDITKDSGSEQL